MKKPLIIIGIVIFVFATIIHAEEKVIMFSSHADYYQQEINNLVKGGEWKVKSSSCSISQDRSSWNGTKAIFIFVLERCEQVSVEK